MIAKGFTWAAGGEETAARLFEFAGNPFLALLVGMLATALVQSSSTVTSIIVALVAAGMPVSVAVPMVMGANIGTTVTNTLVSLGHMRDSQEFRRAFAAATVHDFFNILSVVIFLPFEMAFGVLERTSEFLVGFLMFEGSASIKHLNVVGILTKPVASWLGEEGLLGYVLPGRAGGVVLSILAVAVIILSIGQLGRLLRRSMTGSARRIFELAMGRGPIAGIAAGTVITVLVQSSSTTTSLIVPFAGSGVLSLGQVFPFTLGANIGTCITALLAATAITGEMARPALQIALVHLIYNIAGTLVIYGVAALRKIPLMLATRMAELASARRLAALAYMLMTFFVVPGTFVGISYAVREESSTNGVAVPGVTAQELQEAEALSEELSEQAPELVIE
jgi:sodium-dependent phosphate cotransporter